MASLALVSRPSLATHLSASIAPRVKSVCDKSAGNFHKTQRETIVGPIVMVALVPIMSLVAKPVRLASPR
jgi:hypothetical protein